MNIREFLNNNSAVATIMAVVLLVIALGVIVWQSKGPSAGQFDSFYYDLNTQEIFVDDATLSVPFDRGTGTFEYFDGAKGSAVRAMIFTCNDPAEIKAGMTLAEIEAAGGFVAYLERLSPQMIEMQAKMQAGQEPAELDLAMDYSGGLISTIEGKAWFGQESEQGMQLMTAAFSRCGQGQNPKICRP